MTDEPAGGPQGPTTTRGEIAGKVVTMLLVIGPVAALGALAPLMWGRLLPWRDIVVGGALFLVTGFGISIGYHRLFTHRSFRAKRWFKIVLAVVGSFAMEGSVTGWVANHRRHHRFSDRAGDPHSPHEYGRGLVNQLHGFAHAQVGWLFSASPTSVEVYASDLLEDRDLARVGKLFPLFAILSIGAPFALGWTISGTLAGATTMLLWAGLVRMMLLHHVTWSVNSVCHMFGKQPAGTHDQSRNFAPLALVSFGESWHNFHHAHPASARHGALPRQLDPSAALISAFERFGWVDNVRWPSERQIASAMAA
jgi:stearoyl-CoA desaturase (delta-9 desaturase)